MNSTRNPARTVAHRPGVATPPKESRTAESVSRKRLPWDARTQRSASPLLPFLAAWLSAGWAAAQVTFQVVPATNDLAGMGSALALSEDGSALSGVGWSVTNWAPKAFRWTASAGTTPIEVPSGVASSAWGVSDSGTVVAGWCFLSDGGAFIWNNGAFQTVTYRYGAAIRAVSADGTLAVGANPPNNTSGIGVAAQWAVGSGTPTSLGDLAGGSTESEARRISADNSTIVGWGTSAGGIEAFRRQGSTMSGLGDLPGGKFFSQAFGVSSNGSVVVGRSDSTNGMQAFRWSATNGMTALGDLAGGAFYSEATGVSGDGAIIVGASTSAGDTEVFVWDATRGLRSLAALLQAAGVDVSGWRFTYCKPVISGDGNALAGEAIDPDYDPVIWRLTGLHSILGAVPRPRISLTASGGTPTLEFLAEAGFRYQVQSCAQLGAGAVWQNVGSEIIGDGVEHQLAVTAASPACFWRLMIRNAAP
jgi:probable HAF family extracellular repeat protein